MYQQTDRQTDGLIRIESNRIRSNSNSLRVMFIALFLARARARRCCFV